MGLAGVGHLHPGQLVSVGLDQVGCLEHRRAALGRCGGPPAGKGRSCGRARDIDVGGFGFGGVGVDLTGGRVLDGPATSGSGPLVPATDHVGEGDVPRTAHRPHPLPPVRRGCVGAPVFLAMNRSVP